MDRLSPLLCLLALLITFTPAWGTTIIPPTFDELVLKAVAIFEGTVLDRRSAWDTTPGSRAIVTTVTFRVGDVLKGNVPAVTSLTFLGGTVGDLALRVSEMPEFTVGDRDLLFVAPEANAACPLIGFGYGRMRVVRNSVTGVDEVRTHNNLRVFAEGSTRSLLPSSVDQRPDLASVVDEVRRKIAALGGR